MGCDCTKSGADVNKNVTPQVRQTERSEGSQNVQNSGDPSRKKTAL
jgi:hypothetical protein